MVSEDKENTTMAKLGVAVIQIIRIWVTVFKDSGTSKLKIN